MNTVQVYDPPMCCSTGICGPEVDPNLVQFAALLSQLQHRGVAVERYNLGQQPMAFVQNPKVKALLQTEITATVSRLEFVKDSHVNAPIAVLSGSGHHALRRADRADDRLQDLHDDAMRF